MAFYVATGLSLIGLILAFYIKKTTPAEDRAAIRAEENEYHLAEGDKS